MVEILEKGNPKKYTIKCCHCGSILRFTHLDEKENFSMDGFEGMSSDWYVKCPSCGLNVPTRAITEQNSYDWRSEDIQDDVKASEIWSWNETDDEYWRHYTFDSREEAIEDALANLEDIKSYLETDTPTIYLGRCEYVPLRTNLDADRAMEYLDELYCDDSGCDYYIYECVTDEQRQWLENKLSDVMVEFHKMIGLKPCWFRVVKQETIDLCEYEKDCSDRCQLEE